VRPTPALCSVFGIQPINYIFEGQAPLAREMACFVGNNLATAKATLGTELRTCDSSRGIALFYKFVGLDFSTEPRPLPPYPRWEEGSNKLFSYMADTTRP